MSDLNADVKRTVQVLAQIRREVASRRPSVPPLIEKPRRDKRGAP